MAKRSPFGSLSTKVVAPPGEKAMYLVKTNGRRVNMGVVPHETTVSAGHNVSRLARPGRLDVIRPMGRTNREIQFEQVITSGTGRNSVDGKLNELRKIVESGARVKITGGSWASENGRWYVATSMSVKPIYRSAINNYSRAEVSWSFVEFSDATVRVLKASSKPKVKTSKSRKKSAPKKTTKKKKTTYKNYKIKRGDTLTKIAKNKLGNANKWRSIWAANKSKIKNPNKLKVGVTIKIPKK